MATRAQQARLDRLMAEGERLYSPRARAGLGEVRFTPVQSGKVWGDPAAKGRSVKRFMRWLERSYPEIYQLAMIRAEKGVDSRKPRNGNGNGNGNGMGQANGTPSLLDRFLDSVSNIGTTYLQYKQQKDVLDMQLDRARQGLPPLETGQYAPAVQVGLDQETVQRIANEASARAGRGLQALTSQPIFWIGGGLLVFALLQQGGGSRRRRR